MSNSVFQSVIVQLKDATDRVLGVMDAEGSVVACTDVTLLGERWSDAALAGNHQQYAQRETDHISNQAGPERHVQGFHRAVPQKGEKLFPCHGACTSSTVIPIPLRYSITCCTSNGSLGRAIII